MKRKKFNNFSTIIVFFSLLVTSIITQAQVDSISRKDTLQAFKNLNINEILVVGMQMPFQKRATGYSLQVIKVNQEISKGNNLLNILAGSTPGFTLQSSGGAPGESFRMVLRGNNSIDPLAENQPQFILNGMPVDNSTNEGFGSGESFAYSNRIIDINTDDISEITILKGAASASLYGMGAANGVVLMETNEVLKQGLQIKFSTGFLVNKVTQFPELQKKYMAGWYGKPNYLSYSFPFHAFGPLADTVNNARFYDNLENFFQTGSALYQNISVMGKDKNAYGYISFSNKSHNGVVPSSNLTQRTASIKTGYNFSEKFNAEFFSQYSFNSGILIPQGNEAEITSGALAQLYYYPTSIDVSDYQKEDGTMKTYTPWVSNPIYLAKNYQMHNKVHRYIGVVNLEYDLNKNTKIYGVSGVDSYLDSRERVLPGPTGFIDEKPLSTYGEIQLSLNYYNQLYGNVRLEHVAQIKEFQVLMMVGNELLQRKNKVVDLLGNRFNIPGFYHISNTEQQRILTAETDKNNAALYGLVSLNYSDYWFTTFTGRQDWTSTLSYSHKSFFYPAVSSSLIFSDIPKLSSFFNRLKLNFGQYRISYAEVGKDARPYQIGNYFNYYKHFNNQIAFTKYHNSGSENLKPERTQSIETGVFLSFLKTRIEADFTYYYTVSSDLILNIPVSQTIGFETITANSGKILNRGIELSLRVKPIVYKRFGWGINLGFSKNKNTVLELADGLSYIELPNTSYMYGGPVSLRLDKGYAYGNIYGTSYSRYNPQTTAGELDSNAPLLINNKGFPIVNYNPKILGNIQPDYILHITNTIWFRNLKLSFLVEFKKGGDVFNQPEAFFAAQGTSIETLNRDKTIVFDGVNADGFKNQTEVWLGQGVYQEDGINYGDGYYRDVYRKVAENFVMDASWLKLRDLNLSYKHEGDGTNDFQVTGFIGLSNLIIWTPYKGFDPESSQFGAGSNMQGFQGRGNPAVSSIYGGITVNF